MRHQFFPIPTPRTKASRTRTCKGQGHLNLFSQLNNTYSSYFSKCPPSMASMASILGLKAWHDFTRNSPDIAAHSSSTLTLRAATFLWGVAQALRSISECSELLSSHNNYLNTTAEGLDSCGNLCWIYVGHGRADGGLQSIDIPVAGGAGLLLNSPPQVVVAGVQIRAVGRLHAGWPEVRHGSQQLDFLGLMGWGRVLLEGELSATSHLLHPGNHRVLQNPPVDLLTDLQAHREEVWWHDVPLW